METYYINGMHCNGCVKRATKFISEIPGVKSVKVSLVSSKAIIDTDREIGFETVNSAVVSAGYELTTESPSFGKVFSAWFKKYLPLILAFSLVLIFTGTRGYLYGFHLHSSMTDFMGAFFLLFGGMKVTNWKKYSKSFQNYDPLASKLHLYSYIYPALEVFLGVVYIFGIGNFLIWNIVTALILGVNTVGVINVLKSGEMVQCACLGAYFNIPITRFTIFENGIMVAMAMYMVLILI